MPTRFVELAALSVALLALIAVNGFFVLAEFAIVRVRPSRVNELVAHGARHAGTLLVVQKSLDEHLGVCQIGITFASVALGVVSQRVAQVCSGGGEGQRDYVVAVALAYFVVTGSHVVLGEMLPKAVAIRMADALALRCAGPLRVARAALFPLLWLFTAVAAAVARLLRLPRTTDEEKHSEQELRILLDRFQERGEISFQRLLFMENVFDLGQLRVRDVMRPRRDVELLDAGAPWSENLAVIRRRGFTRYPLVRSGEGGPGSYVHLKDLVLDDGEGDPDLVALARPLLRASEDTPLESLLGEMQRRRVHAAVVADGSGAWTGFVTLEDAIEEIVGTLRDEFDAEPRARLADALTVDRVQLDVEGDSPVDAVRRALARIPVDRLPFPPEWIALTIEERERDAATYMGDGVAIPHARLADLRAPFAMILRSPGGVPCAGTTERAHLLFVLLTPAGQPRVHQALLQVIARLLLESRAIRERLHHAARPEEVLEVVRAGELSLDARGGDEARAPDAATRAA